jgi:hypothetical protein
MKHRHPCSCEAGGIELVPRSDEFVPVPLTWFERGIRQWLAHVEHGSHSSLELVPAANGVVPKNTHFLKI